MKTRHLFMIIILFYTTQIIRADWTQWRGPNGNGITYENGWNPRALDGNPKILWQTNIGKGHGHVCVKGDRLYALGNTSRTSGTDTLFTDIVYCINSQTGTELWRYSYPSHEGGWPGPRTTPVLDENRLYTVGRHGDVFCFNADNGSVLWKKSLGRDYNIKISNWGFCSSPIVKDDLLLFTGGQSGIALNKMNGRLVWSSNPRKNHSLATPVLFQSAEKQLAAIMDDKTLYAVDIRDGSVQWQYAWSSTMDPVILGDQIYLSGGRKGSSLIQLNGEKPVQLWQEKKITTQFMGCVVWEDHAYSISRVKGKQQLQCVDVKKGEIKWTERLNDTGSLIVADGKLVIIEGQGNLIIAEASPVGYQEISRAMVLKDPEDSGIPNNRKCNIWTIPVLTDSKIYVRNTWGDVVCVVMR